MNKTELNGENKLFVHFYSQFPQWCLFFMFLMMLGDRVASQFSISRRCIGHESIRIAGNATQAGGIRAGYIGRYGRVHLGGAHHLGPSDRLLQVHQLFFVLIAFHEDASHFRSGEPLPLRHGHIFLYIIFNSWKFILVLFLRKQQQPNNEEFSIISACKELVVKVSEAVNKQLELNKCKQQKSPLTSSSSCFLVFSAMSSLVFLASSSNSLILSCKQPLTVCNDLISSLSMTISLLNWSNRTIRSSLSTFNACLY